MNAQEQIRHAVGWGFLGAGHLATKATAAALHATPEAELVAVAARDKDRALALEPKSAYDDYRAVLEDSRVEVVYIALSNDLHVKWIIDSIEAGKHVLCEKPLTLSGADTNMAFDAAAASDLLLVEATWALWHPRIQRIVKLVRDGFLGDFEVFEGSFTFDRVRAGNYRLDKQRGGGSFYDTGIYPLNALCEALPELVMRTCQSERDENETGADLTTQCEFEFEGGPRARILSSFVITPAQTLRFEGSQNALEVADNQAYTSWRSESSLRVGQHVETFPAVDAYQLMFSAVSRRIRGENAWVNSPAQSIKVANMVDAVYEVS